MSESNPQNISLPPIDNGLEQIIELPALYDRRSNVISQIGNRQQNQSASRYSGIESYQSFSTYNWKQTELNALTNISFRVDMNVDDDAPDEYAEQIVGQMLMKQIAYNVDNLRKVDERIDTLQQRYRKIQKHISFLVKRMSHLLAKIEV